MPRAQDKALINAFLREATATNFTMDTTVSIAGPIDLLQIQFDVLTGATDTSFEIFNGTQSVKSGSFLAGAGTREVTFMGRVFAIDDYLEITRPVGDSHDVFVTLAYYKR